MRRLLVILSILTSFVLDCKAKEVSYESPESLNKARVAVAMGTSYDEYLTTNFKGLDILRNENMSDVIAMVLSQKADFAVLDMQSAQEFIADGDKIEIVDPLLFNAEIAAGISNGKPELRDEFNKFLEGFLDSDTFAEIKERWSGPSDEVEPKTIELPKTGKSIKVGVSSFTAPFCFIKDNELVGIDIEIIHHFALEYGYELKFSDMNFNALLAAIENQRLDIVVSSLSVTEDRGKNMLFSLPYYQIPAVVVARKSNKPASTNDLVDNYSLERLGSSRVAVAIGTTQDLYVSAKFPGATITRVEAISDVFPIVNSGKADYGVIDFAIVDDMRKSNSNIMLVDKNLYSDGIGVAFNLKNEALRDEFNLFLEDFMKTNTFADMTDRWINGKEGELPKFEYDPNGKVIKLGLMSAPHHTVP